MSNDQPAGNLWSRFWFTPVPPTGLHVLRLLSGCLFAFWLVMLLGHQESFFSLRGFLDVEALRELQSRRQQDALIAPLGWSILYVAGESAAMFQALYLASIGVFVLFALGVATRVTGFLSWLAVASFAASPAVNYDGDYLLVVLAFHLMLGYVFLGQWNGELTLFERIVGSRRDFLFAPMIWPRVEQPASYSANFAIRLFQVHFAIIVFLTLGLHKLQNGDWWSGIAYWHALHPTFQVTAETIQRERASAPTMLFLLSLIQYCVLAWQIGFPVFAWRQGAIARTILIGGAALGWAGAVIVLKLPLFGPFLFIGALSFLSPAEWAWIKSRVLPAKAREAHPNKPHAASFEIARK